MRACAKPRAASRNACTALCTDQSHNVRNAASSDIARRRGDHKGPHIIVTLGEGRFPSPLYV